MGSFRKIYYKCREALSRSLGAVMSNDLAIWNKTDIDIFRVPRSIVCKYLLCKPLISDSCSIVSPLAFLIFLISKARALRSLVLG